MVKLRFCISLIQDRVLMSPQGKKFFFPSCTAFNKYTYCICLCLELSSTLKCFYKIKGNWFDSRRQ